MNYTGLYNPFKLNRPLNDEDIKNQLRQDFSGMGMPGSIALDDATVIKMNSTYLEVVDKYYIDRGMLESLTTIMLLSFLFMSIGVLFSLLFNSVHVPNSFSRIIGGGFIIFVGLCMAVWLSSFLRKSWFTWTHYPVRFNRKTKMVHIFKVGGEIISVPWKDIYFTRGRAAPGASAEWSIDGHILAEDGITVTDTFSLGFSNPRRELTKNWAFVRSYMEVDDCLPELADIVALCPPIAERRESYIFGLQYMMRVESRMEWLFTLVLFPLTLLGSFARFIAMRTSKIPRWPEEIEQECRVDANDPINVSAANNPRHLWRYILANQKKADYNALYQRQMAAEDRLRKKVQAHNLQRSGE